MQDYIQIGNEDDSIEVPAYLAAKTFAEGLQRCPWCKGLQSGPGQPIAHAESCAEHPDYDDARHDVIMYERFGQMTVADFRKLLKDVGDNEEWARVMELIEPRPNTTP